MAVVGTYTKGFAHFVKWSEDDGEAMIVLGLPEPATDGFDLKTSKWEWSAWMLFRGPGDAQRFVDGWNALAAADASVSADGGW